LPWKGLGSNLRFKLSDALPVKMLAEGSPWTLYS
jgi:hypothetical protein